MLPTYFLFHLPSWWFLPLLRNKGEALSDKLYSISITAGGGNTSGCAVTSSKSFSSSLIPNISSISA